MKILKGLGIALGIIVILAVLFLWFWDFSRYEPDIEAAVSEATGRDFRIDGDFDVDVLPSPTVLIEGASLANADWSESPEMLEVGRAYVKIDFWSVLFRPVVIREFELRDVNVLLEANADGETNWDIGGEPEPEEEAPEDEGTPESPIDLHAANISNVTLTYRHPDAEDVVVALESLVVATDDEDRKQLDASARWSDLPIGLRGSFANRESEIEATFGDVRFNSTTQMPDDSMDFTASFGSLADLGKLIDVENLPVEDLALKGNVAVHGDSVILSGIAASLSGLEVTLDGELDGADSSARLSVGARGDSLAFFDAGLPGIPYLAEADIELADEVLDIQPFTFGFGESRLAGTLRVEGGDRPAISMDASSERIDLRPFSQEEDDEQKDEAAETDASSESDEFVFKDEPLPLEQLASANADISLTIADLVTSAAEFRNVDTKITLEDGLLTARNSFEGGQGGDYLNELTLSTSGGDNAQLDMKATVRDLKLGITSGPETPSDLIPATNLDLNVSAAGGSPRALASSLDGSVVVTQGPGRVKNDLIEKFSGDIIAQLFNALNPFAKDEEFTNWECSVFALDFDSGAGEITGFLLQSEKLMVVGGGSIDLNTEKLDIEFNTKPRSGVGVSADMFVTPFVKLSGTLASPSVGLNAKGALLSGGAAFLTGGMSFLYKGLVDRATAEGGRCEEALESVKLQVDDAGD